MRAARWSLLLGLAVAACEARWPVTYGSPPLLVRPDLSVVESQKGELVGIDPLVGKVKWRFLPQPDPMPPYAAPAPVRLVCPMVLTPDSTIVLRYPTRLYGLGADGVLRWEMRMRSWARDDLLCGAAAPDSDTIVLSGDGRTYMEVSSAGELVRVVDFSFCGAAAAAPMVLPVSGDVLIRTRDWLVSFNPEGELNWTVRYEPEPPESAEVAGHD